MRMNAAVYPSEAVAKPTLSFIRHEDKSGQTFAKCDYVIHSESSSTP